MQSSEDFLRERLPDPPARVLEVGCGQGELTTALAVAGYDVVGIDPAAPEGELFRRLTLEDLDVDVRYDAVVAAYSSITSAISTRRSRRSQACSSRAAFSS